MSENQTLSMMSNDTDNRPVMQNTEFKEVSVKDESIVMNDLAQNSKELRESAMVFFKKYKVLEETFPLNRLKESQQLKIKLYKQSTYYGELHNGKKHGLGVLIYSDGRIYQGQWFQDQKKGYGTQKFPNACWFKGHYLNGKPSGTGTYIWPNGERYDGQWLNGFKHGSGMWRGQRGDSYKGEWRFGKPEGYGVHTFPNGDTYQGQFKQCLKHGQGIERFGNGDMYKGRYENGKPSGYGQYYWFNGCYFKGNFVNGLRDGKGIWKRGPGHTDHYEGNYRNDKKWGQGVYTWATGNVYKGSYEADTRNGYGQMYWTNGSYYKGAWLNGIQHGEGQIFIPTEGYKKGIFDNNNLIEVWQQRFVQKSKAPKAKMRIRTEKQAKRAKDKCLIRSCKNPSDIKNYANQHSRTKTAHTKSRQPRKQAFSLAQIVEKQRIAQQQRKINQSNCEQRLQKPQKQFFSTKYTNTLSRKRVETFTNENSDQRLRKSQNEVRRPSKDRLLHSSFYLYKLNVRHNHQTMKNLKKIEGDQTNNNRASVLFMGKLYPQDH